MLKYYIEGRKGIDTYIARKMSKKVNLEEILQICLVGEVLLNDIDIQKINQWEKKLFLIYTLMKL